MFPLPVDPDSTNEAKDGEGWVHTGDVAAIDERGRFQIIDRVKVSLQGRTRTSLILNSKLRRTS